MSRASPAPTTLVRCAIYTRKSTEEGLDQQFNSLDAQRESGEAYIASQRREGWRCLPDRYDDGGFTGGNMERPALQRLLDDVASGRVDCVVVYKVDRLSRSLLDFARIIEVFEKHRVSFVSVTQQFNTATSMGRLVLNVLLSFAQFEREIISERTRDKIAAARRKGKYAGGHPLLGYDGDPRTRKLLINEEEAEQVRAIYQLYLERRGLIPVVQELARRGWTNKRWQTRKGTESGGKLFTKTGLHYLLTNLTYRGKAKYKQEVHEGEHEAIVDHATFQAVQKLLTGNGAAQSSAPRNPGVAMLRGLLRCKACSASMTPTHTCREGNRRYRYYVCINATKHGRSCCPSGYLPASQIEEFVWQQVCAARSLDPGKQSCEMEAAEAADVLLDTPPAEQAAIVQRVIERVEYDAPRHVVVIGWKADPFTEGNDERHGNKLTGQARTTELPFIVIPYRRHPSVRRRKPQSKKEQSRTPLVARLMALAIHFDGLLRRGKLRDYAEIAALGHVSRARVTQIMNLALLAPDIQEALLFLPPVRAGRDPIQLAQLQPLLQIPEWAVLVQRMLHKSLGVRSERLRGEQQCDPKRIATRFRLADQHFHARWAARCSATRPRPFLRQAARRRRTMGKWR